MNKIIIEALERAKEIINNPKNWTKGAVAKNKNNQPVIETSPKACKFSLNGALHRAIYEMIKEQKYEIETLRQINNNILMKDKHVELNENPETTHEDILQLLDNTIKLFSE